MIPFRVHPSWPPELLAGAWEHVGEARVRAARAELERVIPELSARFVDDVCLPLSGWLATREAPPPLIAAFGAPPGSGKSTLVRALRLLLERLHGLSSTGFSLDDVYLTKTERALLAREVHPLLATRGVPGTHDLSLAHQLLDELAAAAPDHVVWLPRFDKLHDDRAPRETWEPVSRRPDVVLLDNWFWGTAPGDAANLQLPRNEREATEDPDGSFRRHVRQELAGPYQSLFGRANVHVQLTAPSWETTLRWRAEQQVALRGGTEPDPELVARNSHFLQLLERWLQLPHTSEPDLTLALDERRELLGLSIADRQARDREGS